MNQDFSILHWKRAEFLQHVDDIKRLRKQYEHYPYLYDYDDNEESSYLNAYLQAGELLDAFVSIDGEAVNAISIGCPLLERIPICSGLGSLSMVNDKTYYFGDIIVMHQVWGQGIADALYAQHIQYVRAQGYKNIIALIVERDNDDVRKPVDYRPSQLWVNHGFEATEYYKHYEWRTFSAKHSGSELESNTLRVYEKVL